MPDLLSQKQLAAYLQLSQRTVYRLLLRGEIPGGKVGGQWRFRKAAVDEWLDLNLGNLEGASLDALETDSLRKVPVAHPIADLIRRENCLILVAADSRDEAVRSFLGQIVFPEPVDVDLVVERVLERERLCSTALADGVALLHTPRSRPRVLSAHDLVAIGRLELPIDFGALDGSRTDTLILLLARSERDQLAFLAKLARLCREPDLLPELRTALDAAEVADLVARGEERLFAPVR